MSKSMSKPQFILGWDIGGAHIKAVLLDAKGNYVNSIQLACPLWRGLDFLARAIVEVQSHMRKNIGLYNIMHAITMTGELVDLFENRHEGVCEIAKVACKMLGENVHFYAAETADNLPGFVAAFDVPRFASSIASANWHASANFLSQHIANALLIDIGSTTSDIIPIVNGRIGLNGNSDVARLKNDSLIYTGVVRTPIMALAQKLPFFDGDEDEADKADIKKADVKKTNEINVMAELFATTGDVYRLTGDLHARVDLAETADGKGKSPLESARRLARMIGYDVDNSLERWITLSFACKALQMQQIKSAVTRHLQPNMVIVGAGAGAFLAQQIAADLQVTYLPIASIFKLKDGLEIQSLEIKNTEIEVCLPAFAVAKLLQDKNSV
jgi:(4-(4-[2-(gamma-L-glutamylamino)ethyl]phenoxymethyl)furan-2-yl)methanamine synthase